MVWDPCAPNPCCPPPAPAQSYQPLPISTGTIGYDRCGNVEVYAAPRTVRRPVAWHNWPIPPSFPGASNSGGGWNSDVWPGGWTGGGGYPGWGGGGGWWGGPPWVMPPVYYPPGAAPPWWPFPTSDLAAVLTGGAAMAQWLIANRPAPQAARRARR